MDGAFHYCKEKDAGYYGWNLFLHLSSLFARVMPGFLCMTVTWNYQGILYNHCYGFCYGNFIMIKDIVKIVYKSLAIVITFYIVLLVKQSYSSPF
ncbi:MAG TPA: hypothetical protein DDX85_05125 [Nitrospiraceae bacterium]|nr:hypothetical protein [Nitrospiraceae bacterium]